MLTMMEAKRADQKEATCTPGTTAPANMNISALITRMKKPSVTMVNGKVRRSNTGRTTALSTPRIAAASKALPKLSSLTPEITDGTITIARVVITSESECRHRRIAPAHSTTPR